LLLFLNAFYNYMIFFEFLTNNDY
jgi:hypothetical protein